MSYIDYRPRLSIVLDEDTARELNELLGEWRIKNRLYLKITKDLIKVLRQMTPQQRRSFIVAILDSELKIEEYQLTVRKVKGEKGEEDATPRP